MRRLPLRHYLFSRLWFVPLVCVVAGVILSIATLALDRHLGNGAVPKTLTGDPDGAFAILSTIAAAMVTLTTLVLTVTMVVVQLAMQQFSPRVLRTILRDRPSQAAIGVFVATFAQAMIVLPEVRSASSSDPGYVPGVSIVVSYVLVLVCIMVLVTYVNHIGMSLRAAALIDSVGDELSGMIDRLYAAHPEPTEVRELPSEAPPTAGTPNRSIQTKGEGVLFDVNCDELVAHARRSAVVIEVVPRIGDYLPRGAEIMRVFGEGAVDEEELRRGLLLGPERTLHSDVAYAIRLLVDVAVKSASADNADPTTAVQAIDRIHSALRDLVVRPFPSGRHVDEDGTLRLLVPELDWDGYVHLALDEIRLISAWSIQVTRRLSNMLDDLLEAAPPDRRGPLEVQRRLLQRGAERAFEDEEDVEFALQGDQQGIGSRASLRRPF